MTVDRPGRLFEVRVFFPRLRGAHVPVPLIVFSPGFDIAPDVYDQMVTGWASLGLVVAVADYPFTAAGTPGGVNEADIVRHPADLMETISALIAASRSSGVLGGLIDPARIGVAGHSDGGDVTDAVVSDSCCRDARIRAAAVMSGAELTSFGGTYGPGGIPLLVVQGDSDTINAPSCSEQIYAAAGTPRFYLDLRGAGHLPPYTSDPYGVTYQHAVQRVTALFWEAYLEGQPSASVALRTGAGIGSPATWTAGGPVTVTGACPGAP